MFMSNEQQARKEAIEDRRVITRPVHGTCETCGNTRDLGIVTLYPCCGRTYCGRDCHQEAYRHAENYCAHGDPCCEECQQNRPRARAVPGLRGDR